MLNITVKGKRKRIPDQWNEISYGKALAITGLVDEFLPEAYKAIYYSDGESDVPVPSTQDNAQLLEFQIKYLSTISGIEEDVFRSLRPKHGVDVHWLFERCSKFMGYPTEEECECRPCIEVGGERYYRVLETLDSYGTDLRLGESDYATYATGMTVQSLIDMVHKGEAKIKEQLLLTAVLFRPLVGRKSLFRTKQIPEPYNYTTVSKRAKLFEDAKASDVFGAYFFLQREQQKRVESLSHSLKSRLLSQGKKGLLVGFLKQMINVRWWLIGFYWRTLSRKKPSSLPKERTR